MSEQHLNISSSSKSYELLESRYISMAQVHEETEAALMRERALRSDLVAQEVDDIRAKLRDEIMAELKVQLQREYSEREAQLQKEYSEREAQLDKEQAEVAKERADVELKRHALDESRRNLDNERMRMASDREKMLESLERKTIELQLQFQATIEEKTREISGQGIMRLEGLTVTLIDAVNAGRSGDLDSASRYLSAFEQELHRVNDEFVEKLHKENDDLKKAVLSKSQQNAVLVRNAYLKKHEGFALTDEERTIIQKRNDLLPLNERERSEYNQAVAKVKEYEERVRAEKAARRLSGQDSHGRNPIPANFLRLNPILLFPEGYNERDCDIIGWKIHEEVVPIKERYMVRVTKRAVVVLKSDADRKPLTAPLPEGIIYKSCASPELLAQLEYRRFCLHLPWYRQEKMMRQEGFPLNRSTMCDWHEVVCDELTSLYECQINEVMKSRCLAADGCPMPMIDNEKHRTVNKYLVEIRSIDSGIPIFRAAPPELFKGNWRGKAVIQHYLKDWKGEALMCDACPSYDWLKKESGVTLCRCAAHSRREVERALGESRLLAEEALLVYQQIYALEAMVKYYELSGDAISDFRCQYELPLWSYLYKWCLENLPKVNEGSLINKAINYILRHFDELTAYINIPEMPLDNNDTERCIREMVMGKQAYLFCESEEACYNSAMMYTFFGACKVLNKNPERWLAYVLKRIKTWPKDRLIELLPQNWIDTEN